MNPNWTDFEKYVFQKLSDLDRELADIKSEISDLKARSAVWGAIGGAFMVVMGELAVKAIAH